MLLGGRKTIAASPLGPEHYSIPRSWSIMDLETNPLLLRRPPAPAHSSLRVTNLHVMFYILFYFHFLMT